MLGVALGAKGDAKLEPINLNEAISATLALANSELVARQTTVSFDPGQTSATVELTPENDGVFEPAETVTAQRSGDVAMTLVWA